jgi:hypothetical protein
MSMTSYRTMTEPQATKALDEYLAERPAALDRLRAELAADGVDPEAMLDGTPDSLTPLWRWVATRIVGLADDPAPVSPDAPAPPEWPSWARYTSWLRRSTPAEVVTLLDGFVSYLGQVITAHAPEAAWQVAHHRIKAYHLQNHPVLTSPLTDSHIFTPVVVSVTANRLRSGLDPLREDEFTSYAVAVIGRLRGQDEADVAEPEPLVEVGSDDDDGVFDVGLREDVAHEHSRKVDRLVAELAQQPGIISAFREDREVLLVTAPDWDAEDLQRWVLHWLTTRLPALA